MTYSSMISGYAKVRGCDRAEELWRSMRESRVRPNVVTYNALLDARVNDQLAQAEELLGEMKQEEVSPTVVTYNALLKGLAKASLPSAARQLLQELPSRRLEPTAISFNTCLDACGQAGDVKAAREVLQASGGAAQRISHAEVIQVSSQVAHWSFPTDQGAYWAVAQVST
ncbi:Pentatricopeptide repeat-containing protein At2g31400 [Durusdinium trenchii]|uniref:Chloroplastic n=1 Tax=Durusdinium trenchii TaxID=1381693 RepID=A0ABP0N042_9DINO